MDQNAPDAFDDFWKIVVGDTSFHPKTSSPKEMDLNSGFWIKLHPLPGEVGWEGEIKKVFID